MEELLTNLSFFGVMGAVCERLPVGEWMKREYVPQKDAIWNSSQHFPHNFGCLFGNRSPLGWALAVEGPPLKMFRVVNVVGKRKARPAPTAVAKVSTEP